MLAAFTIREIRHHARGCLVVFVFFRALQVIAPSTADRHLACRLEFLFTCVAGDYGLCEDTIGVEHGDEAIDDKVVNLTLVVT